MGGAAEVATTVAGQASLLDRARLRSLAQAGLGARLDPAMQAVAEQLGRTYFALWTAAGSSV